MSCDLRRETKRLSVNRTRGDALHVKVLFGIKQPIKKTRMTQFHRCILRQSINLEFPSSNHRCGIGSFLKFHPVIDS